MYELIMWNTDISRLQPHVSTQCNSSDEKLYWAWVGFEPTTCCLHDSRSNQLSYQATYNYIYNFLKSKIKNL